MTPEELTRIKDSVEQGREVLFFKAKDGVCKLMQVTEVNENGDGYQSVELGQCPEFPVFN